MQVWGPRNCHREEGPIAVLASLAHYKDEETEARGVRDFPSSWTLLADPALEARLKPLNCIVHRRLSPGHRIFSSP